jgi:hypothetical protein
MIVPADVAVVENGVIVGAHLTAEADLDALIAALEAIRGHLKPAPALKAPVKWN